MIALVAMGNLTGFAVIVVLEAMAKNSTTTKNGTKKRQNKKVVLSTDESSEQCWLCLQYSRDNCDVEKRFCPLREVKFPTVKISEPKKLERHINKAKTFWLKINDEETYLVSSGVYISGKGSVRKFLASFGRIEEEKKQRKRVIKAGVAVDFSKFSDTLQEEAPPPKKKRGRPRKNEQPIIINETPAPTPQKKKRGRPPKNKVVIVQEEVKEKKKRGRPRKNVTG